MLEDGRRDKRINWTQIACPQSSGAKTFALWYLLFNSTVFVFFLFVCSFVYLFVCGFFCVLFCVFICFIIINIFCCGCIIFKLCSVYCKYIGEESVTTCMRFRSTCSSSTCRFNLASITIQQTKWSLYTVGSGSGDI